MNPLPDLGTVGSIASLLSLVIGFAGGLWWRHISTLIARDREATVSLLGLFEVYRYLQKAAEALGALQTPRSADRLEAEMSVQEALEIQQARDGVISSIQALNTFFGSVYDFKIAGTDPLVRAARYYRIRGLLHSAEMCFEQALALSNNGKSLSDEDRRACVHGLQYYAIALGDQEEAARWAREAKARGTGGCIEEDRIVTWFVAYRCYYLLRLTVPNPLALRRQQPRLSQRELLRK